jgi:hypothetical protein
VSDSRLAFGDCDHGQKFGLPAPVDGTAKSKQLLLQRAIQTAAVRDDTGDLIITFDGAVLLEVLNNSSGYEGWELHQPIYGRGFQVVAVGGGQLAIWTGDAQKSDDGLSSRITRDNE